MGLVLNDARYCFFMGWVGRVAAHFYFLAVIWWFLALWYRLQSRTTKAG